MGYTGKDFEQDFKESFSDDLLPLLIRLYDTTNGFSGIANPCDFVLYNQPYQVCLELKATQGTRLPFDNISETQWRELTVRDKIPGMMAGILVCYYELKVSYFVPMIIVNQIRDTGLKSMHKDDAARYGILIDSKYKRIHQTLNIEKMMEDMIDYQYNFKITEVTRRG